VYVFEPTPPIPTYLYAWAFGKYASVTGMTSRGINVSIHMPVASELLPFQDEWKQNEVTIIEYYEKWTDFELPVKKIDVLIAWMSDSAGMENWSLIILNEDTLIRRTPGMRRDLLLHETFHQWHGNLVSPRNWAHLSLNEGFGRFMPKIFAKLIFDDDTEIEYWKGLSFGRLLRDDELPNSPFPIVMDTYEGDPDDLVSPITYDKAGYVIAMIRDFIGEEGFHLALKKYYRQYAFQSVSWTELWTLLGESADISRFLPLMRQTGYPLVMLDESGAISYSPCSPTRSEERSWTFPLRIRTKASGAVADRIVWVGFEESRVDPNAEWVILNPERELLCRVSYSDRWYHALKAAFEAGEISLNLWNGTVEDRKCLSQWGIGTTDGDPSG
jgi:aminopeptidase N